MHKAHTRYWAVCLVFQYHRAKAHILSQWQCVVTVYACGTAPNNETTLYSVIFGKQLKLANTNLCEHRINFPLKTCADEGKFGKWKIALEVLSEFSLSPDAHTSTAIKYRQSTRIELEFVSPSAYAGAMLCVRWDKCGARGGVYVYSCSFTL